MEPNGQQCDTKRAIVNDISVNLATFIRLSPVELRINLQRTTLLPLS